MTNELFSLFSLNSISNPINVNINYNKPISDSEGYLDYLTINVKDH